MGGAAGRGCALEGRLPQRAAQGAGGPLKPPFSADPRNFARWATRGADEREVRNPGSCLSCWAAAFKVARLMRLFVLHFRSAAAPRERPPVLELYSSHRLLRQTLEG